MTGRKGSAAGCRSGQAQRGRKEMAIVYGVCAILVTVFLGIVGFELAMTAHSLRKLTEEARTSLKDVNAELPELLDNVRVISKEVRTVGECVSGKVNRAATGIEKITGEPLRVLVTVLEFVKDGLRLWDDIRQRKDQDSI